MEFRDAFAVAITVLSTLQDGDRSEFIDRLLDSLADHEGLGDWAIGRLTHSDLGEQVLAALDLFSEGRGGLGEAGAIADLFYRAGLVDAALNIPGLFDNAPSSELAELSRRIRRDRGGVWEDWLSNFEP